MTIVPTTADSAAVSTEPAAVPADSVKAGPADAGRSIRAVVVIIACAVAGSHALRYGLAGRGGVSVVNALVALGAALSGLHAQGRRDRGRARPADRDVDYIVGLPFFALAFALILMLAPRTGAGRWMWRFDGLSVPLVLVGSLVLLYGHRWAAARWRPLLLAILCWPLPLAVLSPGVLAHRWQPLGSVVLVLAGAAVVVGPAGWRRRWILWGAAAGLSATIVLIGLPHVAPWLGQAVPPALTAFTLVVTAAPLRSWLPARSRIDGDEPTIPRFAVVVVLTASLLVGVADWRAETAERSVPVAFVHTADLPQGWRLLSSGDSGAVAERYLGVGASWDRSRYAVDPGPGSAPRLLVVDRIGSTDLSALRAFDVSYLYRFDGTEGSRRVPVTLAPGLDGQLLIVRNSDRVLSWSILTWIWSRPGGGYQRVTLTVTDDPSLDADIPEPDTALVPGLVAQAARLFRGTATDDGLSALPIKNGARLSDLARALVRRQLTGSHGSM